MSGLVDLGALRHATLTADVRRIGYAPWSGKLDLPDTAVTLTVVLPRLARQLAGVTVTAGRGQGALQLTGFYDRWLQKQKGAVSAVFIGPEEIERRHPNKITNMLSGLNGVTFRRSCEGEQIAFAVNGTCPMAILVDGVRQCPSQGCKSSSAGPTGGLGNAPPFDRNKSVSCDSPDVLSEATAVLIDQVLEANDVAAIEVYNRGGNVPVSLSASDQSCGIVAFWTGSRKP